jgi:hypothetical protein
MHKAVWWIFGIIVAHILILLALGQPLICTCGTIKFWEGVVFSEGNSQHITDWYTFSHIIHGFIFYAVARKLFPKSSKMQWLLFSVGVEVAWEIAENTPMVIEHYRQQALAVGYSGDSVLNSISDILSMALGFFAASRLPVWLIVTAAVIMEAFTMYIIRDSLALNVINLMYQFDSIKKWQGG